MDPLAEAMQLLQEAQQVIAMQAEEIQTLRQSSKKAPEGMQKKASLNKVAAIVGMREEDVPEFVKLADENELHNFMSTIEKRARYTAIGKVAEINDGSQADSPAEQLEASLASLIG